MIVVTRQGRVHSIWSTFTALCDRFGFPYHTLKKETFPFEYDGYVLEKLKKNTV